MAAVGFEARRTSATSFEVIASPVDPEAVLYWYEDGELVQVGRGRVRMVVVDGGESLDLEVFDDVDDLPGAGHPSRLTLQWDGVPGAVEYRVRRLVGEAWVLQRVVSTTPYDVGVYSWESPGLVDGEVAVFEVVPVGPTVVTGVEGVSGNWGSGRRLEVEVVKRPAAVDFTVGYVDGVLAVGAV